MKHPLTWIIMAVDLLVLVALAFVYPHAMLSPGALVPAHADLETSCLSCHEPFRGATAERCIACHSVRDIGLRTTSGAPIAPHAERTVDVSFHQHLSEQSCTSCHAEHRKVAQRAFTHSLLQPEMRDRCSTCHAAPTNDFHRELDASCGQCHTTKRWKPATFEHAALAKATLERCQGCHRAPSDALHRKVDGSCAQCHGTQRWKPATFDHNRYFVLDRDHDAACATCHVDNDFERYTCYGCHEHTPANIREEHEEEGVRDFENCVECHRSADDEPEHGERGERRKGGRERGHGDDDEH